MDGLRKRRRPVSASDLVRVATTGGAPTAASCALCHLFSAADQCSALEHRRSADEHRGEDKSIADIHQCPACELKFLNRTELDSHWADEHPQRAQIEAESAEVPDDSSP